MKKIKSKTFSDNKKVISKDVEKFISYQQQHFQNILNPLREIITSTLPAFEESLKFNSIQSTPFYTYKGWICYTGIKQKEFIDFGICKGYKIHSFSETLKSEGRSQVKSIRLYGVSDIDEVLFKEILKEAWMINEMEE